MSRRNYSVAEVESLIPSLEEIFTRILQLRVGLRGLEQKLERAGVSVEVDAMAELVTGASGTDDAEAEPTNASKESPEIRHARAVFRGYYEALSDALEEIRTLGGDVKDLDLGLVDFPGRRGTDDILLCWRLGEKRIEFWHTVEGGFANRRPLDERSPGSSSRAD
jgi:hypothetical protein